jgi:uncharacterized membrane protein
MSERDAKREQFTQKSDKKSSLNVIIIAVVLLVGSAVGGWVLLGGQATAKSLVEGVNGEVLLPVSQVNDGQAHFFSYKAGQDTVKFFVLKSSDGVLRAALDTCDVCYKAQKGYRQEGDQMVCNNCNMKFRTDMINDVKGGCNPAPLVRRIVGGQLVINERDLLAGSWYFGS